MPGQKTSADENNQEDGDVPMKKPKKPIHAEARWIVGFSSMAPILAPIL